MTEKTDRPLEVQHQESIAVEDVEQLKPPNGNRTPIEYGIDEAHQKKVVRRIDMRLLPILGVMYAVSLIDRTNLGLAMVAGLQKDLGLDVGDRYTIIIMVFFVAYIIFEIPSNLVLPKAGAANWLAFLGASFGAILVGMGFTESWVTMAVCRFLLGAMESGFLPGCTYLITCWYTRFEVGKRLASFWLISIIMKAFASIFAYALTLLGGRHGIAGWRWIFIVEGAITVGVCLMGWFIIIDFPTKAGKFLNPEEQQFVIDRINNDRGDAKEDQVTFARVIHHLKDWKLYFWAFNLMASTLPGYAYSYFMPVILKDGMGFSTTESQLLSAPPLIVSAITCYIAGWVTDKYRLRGPILAVLQLITAVGMLITTYGGSSAVRYFGTFLGIGALQFCIPGVLTFQANNITSHSKRALASATCMIGGGLGGIFASVAFKSDESPMYTTGVWLTFGVSLVSISMILIMDWYFLKVNRRAKEGKCLIEGMENWYYTY